MPWKEIWHLNLTVIRQRMQHFIQNINVFSPKNKTDIGQDNILLRFCALVFMHLFIYAIYLHNKDMVMVGLIGIGYAMCAALLIANALFKYPSRNKWFWIVWYNTLIFCIPTVASYAILSVGENNLIIANAALSILALGYFTNSTTFITCLLIGSATGAGIYGCYFDIYASKNLAPFCYVITTSTMYCLFLEKPRERTAKKELTRIHEMANIMAHEAKSPIATSYSYATTVRDLLAMGKVTHVKDQTIVTFNAAIFKDLCEFSNLSIEVAAYGNRTINSLLLNITKEISDVNLEIISVLDCVTAAVNNYTISHRSSAERITIAVHPNFQMMGISYYMEQLVHNLIKNAFRHGGSEVRVRIYNEGRNLIVHDEGRGIPPEVLPFIFNRFYTHNRNGIGIGLAFCEMVIEAFGGTIFCESKPGNFTAFIVKIPKL